MATIKLDYDKLVALASILTTATQAGLAIVNGVKGLAALIGRDLSNEEQEAILALVRVDATWRLQEREAMAGVVPPV